MKKINYRITVNITDDRMKLGFRGQLPAEMAGQKIRVQAVFAQKQTDRRFPMQVTLEETEEGIDILADAEVELPWVFYCPPRRKVTLTFALWCGMEEIILDDQPFPMQKELFARKENVYNASRLRFAVLTAGLPFLLVKHYLQEGKNVAKAKKRTNEMVYRMSGYSYSPRQRNTDYFAAKYRQYVAKYPEVVDNEVLFLSERLPEEGGNLQLVRNWFEKNPDVMVTEFIHTTTVDQLTKEELKECAMKCARAKVIILEDFYPQLHSLRIRPETKVVQLWHACGAFKTFGLTRMGKPGGALQSSMNHRNYDLVTVSSEKLRDIYAEAFGIPTRRVQALGTARTDCLFDWQYKKKKREELYSKYPMLRHRKVVLFAPTFRGDGNKDAFYPEDAFDVNRFMGEMPDDAALIVKHHPFVHQSFPVDEEYKDRVLDLTGQDHINDLMLISDLLITDYSSSIFEAVLLELPVLFYAFDEEEYIGSRDFYFDYEDMVPGPIEHDFAALTERARNLLAGENAFAEGKDADSTARQFRETFLGALDGHSTERICRYIEEQYLGKRSEES